MLALPMLEVRWPEPLIQAERHRSLCGAARADRDGTRERAIKLTTASGPDRSIPLTAGPRTGGDGAGRLQRGADLAGFNRCPALRMYQPGRRGQLRCSQLDCDSNRVVSRAKETPISLEDKRVYRRGAGYIDRRPCGLEHRTVDRFT